MNLPPERLASLRDAARIQSIVTSCRISGLRVSDDEVAAIASADQAPPPAMAEIWGYARAIEGPFPRTGPLVTVEEIGGLNAVVIGKSNASVEPSPLRETPLHLELFDAEGRALGRILQTLPPRLLRDKIEDLVSWLEIELRAGEQHPLIVLGAFFVYFTAISPFDRANGRTARVMIPHLLRRLGYGFVDYASWERMLDDRRAAYYEAIDSAESKIWTDDADAGPWVRFFLDVLQSLAVRLQSKIELERRVLDLPPLQRAILDAIREHGTGAAALLMAATGANRNTLKDNLRRLVERGLLERIGSKRGTFYRLAAAEAPPEPPRAEEA
jgi:Fic/DOC family protein/winged helix DNA-binding protein